MFQRIFVLATALLAFSTVNAAQINASYSQVSGASWAVDFAVTNDGAPTEITGFTIYFSEMLFADLVVDASPAQWDSIAIQPDLNLQSPGFLDSVLLGGSAPLTLGQTQGGFRVAFTFLGVGSAPMLAYDIVDQNFNVLFSGVTAAPIPEPATAVLTGLGLLGFLAFRERLGRQSQASRL